MNPSKSSPQILFWRSIETANLQELQKLIKSNPDLLSLTKTDPTLFDEELTADALPLLGSDTKNMGGLQFALMRLDEEITPSSTNSSPSIEAKHAIIEYLIEVFIKKVISFFFFSLCSFPILFLIIIMI